MTELVLILGNAVVKTAFKLWARDSALAIDESADLTDMIKGQVREVLDQRKVRARFDKMEEIVANQVLSTLNAEFRNLGENERDAAIIAVTETFNRVQFAEKQLFAGDLDPLSLEKFVSKFTGQGTRDLSLDGTVLYDRMLAQCSAYIIEIADKLPRLQSDTFAELLRRDAQILARLEDVLERLPMPAKDSLEPDLLEIAYRRHVATVFDRLEIFGLGFAAQWYPLSIAYVNLKLSTGQTAENVGDTFEAWLAKYPRLLIEGRAGCGKTTILQWIAVRAARGDFEDSASRFNGCIPFFIRLRQYADGQLPSPEEFLRKVAPLLASEEKAGWTRERLRSGRAFVLIDGVDEVQEDQRSAIVAWLHELTEVFPEVRYVVTTRPGAIEVQELDEAAFVRATLDPMGPALIRIFIDQWHAAMQWWQKDAESVEQLASCCDKLMQTLDSNRFVSELASTPLLAGLICALNQYLNARLPRRRSEILETALTMFYNRDRERGIAGNINLDLAATYHLLGDLALWMLRNGVIEARSDSAREILYQSASVLPKTPYNSMDLFHHLLVRSGLLREPAAGYVDFLHRTFHEYLAARALIEIDNIGEIIRNANDDQWREVVILAAGQGNMPQTTALLRGLLRAPRHAGARYQRRLMAVACLGEIRSTDPAVLAEIEKSIPELLPPRSLDQAETLSNFGERIIPHLARTIRITNIGQLSPVIRAASLIGGADALGLISAIAQITRISIREEHPFGAKDAFIPALRDEFMRASQYFDQKTYQEKVLIPLGIHHVRVFSGNRSKSWLPQHQPSRLTYTPSEEFNSSRLEKIPGHAFLSYVREDSAKVAQLQALLQDAGIPVWRDTADLWPGEDWRAKIRHAITNDALVFLACFSSNSLVRDKSYQNEELALAIEQLRQRSPENPWLIPIRLDSCDIPDRDIGYGRTLRAIQHADLFDDYYEEGARRLIIVVKKILRKP